MCSGGGVDEEVAEGKARVPVGGTVVMACNAVGARECLWILKAEVIGAESSSAAAPLKQSPAPSLLEDGKETFTWRQSSP